jgi:hypothetical protein
MKNGAVARAVVTGSLSDSRSIYCVDGKGGPPSPAFSLHSPAMRLEISQNDGIFPTRLATIA